MLILEWYKYIRYNSKDLTMEQQLKDHCLTKTIKHQTTNNILAERTLLFGPYLVSE